MARKRFTPEQIVAILRDPELTACVLDCPATPRRTQKFPRFTSFKMEMSKDRSATNFFSLAFSFSSSLSRPAC